MKYYIAIDSGGYKTESILFEETGKVIAFERGRGANAFDVGVTEATDRLRSAAENMKARVPEGGEKAERSEGFSAAFLSLISILRLNSVLPAASKMPKSIWILL